MLKKVLVVVGSLSVLSAALISWGASTWQLQTKLSNTGGSIQVANKPLQTAAGSIVYSNFTTSTPVPVTVSAAAGYRISSLIRGGSSLPIGNYTSHYSTTFQKSGGSTQALVAGFTAQQYTVTATALGPGSITPTSAKVSYGGKVVLSSAPSGTGSYLTAVTGGSVTDLSGGTPTLPYGGSVQITVANVTGPRTVTATYATYGADAGPDQTAALDATVTLSGSLTGNGSPSWSQTAGPTVALAGVGTLTPSFRPTVTGSYEFRVTQKVGEVTVATATTRVLVVDSLADSMRLSCMGCHGANGVYPRPAVFGGWSSSGHLKNGVSCISCHTDAPMPTPVNAVTVDSDTFAYRSGAGNFCLNGSCHTPGRTHKSTGLACSGCHGNYRGHNPGTTFNAALNACFTCHGAPNGTHFQVKQTLSRSDCQVCHNQRGHDPAADQAVTREHFNGYTSYANPGYAAAYVTPATACADCHQGGAPRAEGDAAILRFRKEWAGSGHGDVKGRGWTNRAGLNWKSLGTEGADAGTSAGVVTDCQRCHTAAGYLRFSKYSSLAPVAGADARHSEPLTCNACHEQGNFSGTRSTAAVTGYYNYSSLATGRVQVSLPYPDSGRSNLCLGCHAGRQAGETVKAMARATAQGSYSSSFWRGVGMVDAHYLASAGDFFGTAGYHYPGQSYGSGGVDHAGLGAGGRGPCVACHLQGSSHTLDTAQGGFALCNGCHRESGTVQQVFLSDRSGQFRAGLKALAAALSSRGFNISADGSPAYPYFGSADLGGREKAPGMVGAALNYSLLLQDPGAFAHNPAYAKRLVRDSIDYLTAGSVERGRDLAPVIDSLLPGSADRENALFFLGNAGNGSTSCAVCHATDLDPLTGRNIVADYGASRHATAPGGAGCLSCHAPSGEAVAHPGTRLLTDTESINAKCLNCHSAHTWESVGICSKCHNGHRLNTQLPAPHLANFSSAQFVTPNVGCDNCHSTVDASGKRSFSVLTEHREWASSAKGNSHSSALTSYDFKTLGTPAPATPATTAGTDCVRCHTTTGYRKYVDSGFTDISPWGTPGDAPGGDRTREMIGCPACHSPSPFDAEFGRIKVGLLDEITGTSDVRSWYNYSSAATGRIVRSKFFVDASGYDLGDSNICITCHAGRAAGDLIKQTITNVVTGKVTCSSLPSIVCRLGNGTPAAGMTGPFWGNVEFIDPHSGSAANLMYPDTLRPGYEYRQATAVTFHANIGVGSTQGPCVGCHMSSAAKHAFAPLSSAVNGTVSAIRSEACAGCHGVIAAPLTAAALQEKKSAYGKALTFIAARLAAKGIHYNRDKAPYFFTTADPQQQGTETRTLNWYYSATFQGANLMGAAFNLRLLDSGSGWVHNGTYAKRILHDTIDYLDDGLQNNSVVTGVTDQQLLNYIYPRL